MEASEIPYFIPTPFSSSDLGNATVPIPTAAQPNGFASWQQGWGVINATNPTAGGIPPIWQDFKGLFYILSAWSQWVQAGGAIPPYNSTFQTTIGGYPNGALVGSVMLPGTYWRSTADNNASDPDTGGANWVPFPQVFTAANPNASFVNLAGSSAGAKTAAWTALQGVAYTALGGAAYSGSNLSLAFNGANNGLNGMAGSQSFPANGSQIDIYGITGPGQPWGTLGNGLLATGAPLCPVSMPSGYTASILIGSFVVASAALVAFQQIGNSILIPPIIVVSGASSSDNVNISSVVPANAKTLQGYMESQQNSSAGVSGGVTTSSGVGATLYGGNSGGLAGTFISGFSGVPILSQRLYYTVTGASGVLSSLALSGYTI